MEAIVVLDLIEQWENESPDAVPLLKATM
jgi:hypothetical protein